LAGCRKLSTRGPGGLNLFKHQSDQALRNSGWRDGDFFLKNDWKGSVKETWKGNSSLLRREMRNVNPIFDSYVDGSGKPDTHGRIPEHGTQRPHQSGLDVRQFVRSVGAVIPPYEFEKLARSTLASLLPRLHRATDW